MPQRVCPCHTCRTPQHSLHLDVPCQAKRLDGRYWCSRIEQSFASAQDILLTALKVLVHGAVIGVPQRVCPCHTCRTPQHSLHLDVPCQAKRLDGRYWCSRIEQYFASAQDILLTALKVLVHGAVIRVPQRVCPCHTCRTPQHSLHLDVPCQAKRLDGRYWCSRIEQYFASAQDILLTALKVLVHGAVIRVPQRVCPCHTCRTPQHSLHLDVPCQAKRLDGRYWCSRIEQYFASAQDILLTALKVLVHGAVIRVPQRVCPCHTCRTPQHSLHLDVPCQAKRLDGRYWCSRIEQSFASAQDILLTALKVLVHGAVIRVPQRVCPCHTCRTPQHSLHLDVPCQAKRLDGRYWCSRIEQYFASAQDILLTALKVLVHGAVIRVPQRVCPCHTCRTPQHSLHLDVPCQAKRLDGRYWCSRIEQYFASAQDILLTALKVLVHGAVIRVPQRVCPCHTCRTPQHSLHLDVPCQAKRLDGRYWCSRIEQYFASAQDILLTALKVLVHGALIRVPQRVCPCHTCRTPQHSLHLDVPCQAKRLDGRYWCSRIEQDFIPSQRNSLEPK